MACTAEGERWMPRACSSRAARTFPISGRSCASARAALSADRATPLWPVVVLPVFVVRIPVAAILVDAALEARGIVDATRALVVGVRRIGAEGPGAPGPGGGGRRRREDALRGVAVLDPVDDRGEGIEGGGR